MGDAAVALSPLFGVPVRSIRRMVHFPARHGPVFDAGGHNKNLARIEVDGAAI
jgi:hypothetical protein